MAKNKQSHLFVVLTTLMTIASLPLIGQTQNGITRIEFPGGGAYDGSGNETGAIKIVLPIDFEKTMLRMRLEVYNHNGGQSFSMWISGFANNNTWQKTSAQIITSSNGADYKVSFGAENGKCIVWVGTHTTNWSFLKVKLAEVLVSYLESDLNDWDSGWSISLDNQDFSSLVTSSWGSSLPRAAIPSTIKNRENDVSRILYPGGGTYEGSANETGALKIKLPVDFERTMLRMRLEVYNYYDNKSFTMWISGFANSNTWQRTSAQLLTSGSGSDYKVSFGAENGKCVVWIGETTSNWSYVQVELAEVLVGYLESDIADWDDGWEISIEDQDFSSQVTTTKGSSLLKSSDPDILKNRESEITRILYPRGATFAQNHPANHTDVGAIKITLPVDDELTLIRFRVEVINYAQSTNFSAWFGGYLHNDSWHFTSAEILTSSSVNDHKVSFGFENGKGVVWIGEITDVWKWLKVEVSELIVAHNNSSIANWDDGWSVMVDNQDFSSKVSPGQVKSSALPLGKGAYWNAIDSSIYFNTGNIAIGTTNPDTFKLAVDGAIKAKEIRVNTTNWPDYVFESDYQLMPLKEVGQFIKKNGHLPDIPSKETAEQEGVLVSEMQRKLLEKVEELTLHLIELRQEVDDLKQENKALKEKVNNQ